MTRVVRDAEGRMWTIRGTASWREPATPESGQFEHDVATGRGAGFALLGLVVAFMVLVIAWTPNNVSVPAYVILLLVLAVLFFPVRFTMRRPWTLVAESAGDYDLPPQRWVGTVHGSSNARRELASTIRNLELYAIPDDGSGPMRQVN